MGGKKNRPKTKWRKLSLDEFKSSETEDAASESYSSQSGRKFNRYHSKEPATTEHSEVSENGHRQDFQDGMEHVDVYEDYHGAEGEGEGEEITGCYVNGLWVPQSELQRLVQHDLHPPLLLPSPTGYTMLVPRPVAPSSFVFPAACIPSSSQQIPPYFRLRSDFRFQKPYRLPRRSFRVAPYWGSLNAPCFANLPPPPHHLPSAQPSTPPPPPPPPSSENPGDASIQVTTTDDNLSTSSQVQPADAEVTVTDRIEDQILTAPSYVYPGYTYGPAVYCPHFVPPPNGGPFFPPPGPLLPPLDFASSRGRRRRRKYRGRFHYGMEGPSREVWRASDEKNKVNPAPKENSESKPQPSTTTSQPESSKVDDVAASKVNVRPTDLDLLANQPETKDSADNKSLIPSILDLAEDVVDRAIREAADTVKPENVEKTIEPFLDNPIKVDQPVVEETKRTTTSNITEAGIEKMADDLAKDVVFEAQKVADVLGTQEASSHQGDNPNLAGRDSSESKIASSGEDRSNVNTLGPNSVVNRPEDAGSSTPVHKKPRFIVVTIPSEELSDHDYDSDSSDEVLRNISELSVDYTDSTYSSRSRESRLIHNTPCPPAFSVEANKPKMNGGHDAELIDLTHDTNCATIQADSHCHSNKILGPERDAGVTQMAVTNLMDVQHADKTDKQQSSNALDSIFNPDTLTQNADNSSPIFVDVPLSSAPDQPPPLLDQKCSKTGNAENLSNIFNSQMPCSDDDISVNHMMNSRTRVENWLLNQSAASPSCSNKSTLGSLASSSIGKDAAYSPQTAKHLAVGSLNNTQANKHAESVPQCSEDSPEKKCFNDQPRASPAYLSFLGQQSDAFIRETEMELNRLRMLQSCKTNQTVYKLAYDETVSSGQSSESKSDVEVVAPVKPPVVEEAVVPSLLDAPIPVMSQPVETGLGRSRSEIVVHERDSASEAGSEDVELLPHRYESTAETAAQKHLYVNKLSLATELLRTKEALPYDNEFKRVVEDSTECESDAGSRSVMQNYYGSYNKTSTKGNQNMGFEGDTPHVVSSDLRKSRMSAGDSGVQSEESSDEVAEEAREKLDPLRTLNSEEEEEQDVWNRTGGPGPRYRRFQAAGQRARAGLPIRDTWPCLCCAIM